MNKKESAFEKIKFVIVIAIFVVIFLVYFNHLSNNSSKRKAKVEKSEIEILTGYDMVNDYPKTPRDVVKLHCKFMKTLYKTKDISDEELVVLNQQVRNLYSSELLKYNPENDNLVDLKKNIQKTKDEGYTYQMYELPEASQVTQYTKDSVEYATLEVALTVDTSDGKGYVYERYVLIKENNQWKIHVWGPVPADEVEGEK